MYITFLEEPRLLACAYDLEQEIQPRSVPEFRGQVPPDAGICDPARPKTPAGVRHLPYHFGTGKPFIR